MKKVENRQGFELAFYKIHGAGNDCLVFNSSTLPKELHKPALVRALCHRQLGLGADQALELQNLNPLTLQIWNQDGSQAEMCANGSRAFAMLAEHEKWIPAGTQRFPLHVSGKAYECLKQSTGFELALGEPHLEGKALLQQDGQSIPCLKISTGNPHAVIFVRGEAGDWIPPEEERFDFKVWGARLEQHKEFPAKANIGFIRSLQKNGTKANLRLEVWERGAGATLSCGSGAVAAATAIRSQFPELSQFAITMNQFNLYVRFEGTRAFLSGPSALVAKGFYYYSG